MASDGIWVPDPDAEDKYPPPKKGMNRMTLKLIRKRAEHNEGIISTLEELTLHQEELVAIEPCLGTTCRKLKILYLQNNIISKIQHLHHLKDLEYLNMALNNVSKIEGLDKCEFLNKLDLTVNFVDVDEFESSMDHLADREHLKDLYMMGNPCEANWPGFKNYVIARLPQLQFLDGEAITRSMQIIAKQQLPKLAVELRSLAQEKRDEKAQKEFVDYRDIDTDENTRRDHALRRVDLRHSRRSPHTGAHEDVRGARRGEGREGESGTRGASPGSATTRASSAKKWNE